MLNNGVDCHRSIFFRSYVIMSEDRYIHTEEQTDRTTDSHTTTVMPDLGDRKVLHVTVTKLKKQKH